MTKEKEYEVVWRLSVTAGSQIGAMEKCWHKLKTRKNDWYWEIQQRGSKKKYEINCDVEQGAEPVITEITNQINK